MNSTICAEVDWHEDLQEWLQPFLAVFKRSEQRCWAPLYRNSPANTVLAEI